MKNIYYLAIALLLAPACKKSATVAPATGTIVTTTTQNMGTSVQNTFTAQDSLTAIGLMQANNLSTDGLVFYAYQSYTALDQNNKSGLFEIISARQVRNGLPVFEYDLNLSFENGKLYGPYPAPQFIAGTISLGNKPNLSLQTLRADFIKEDNAHEAHSISIQDSTLVATLGYYNLNIAQVPDNQTPDYILAWYVHTPRYDAQGYFRDDNGAALFFRPATSTNLYP